VSKAVLAERECVVTGGAGAIGSRLVQRLLEDGVREVQVLDDLSSGYEWLLPKDERVTFVRGDVTQIGTLIPEGKDKFVFHLAAFFANQNSVDHPEADLHTNGLGTLSVLKWAGARQAARVVYASAGCSIAGHGIDGPIREDMPPSLYLDTPYQITKALGEFYCNYFNEQVSTVRCRFFNSFGPGEVPGRYRNVIPNFIWRAVNNKPLIITGTGAETRDFIFVDDLVDGLIRCAVTPSAHGEAFNLGTGKQTRVDYLAEKVIMLTKSSSDITFTNRRAWDKQATRQADISKAGSVINFSPSISFDEGLQRTVAWFQANRDQVGQSIQEEP
jgi:UDP-glucose 4-epimerase